MSSDNNDPRFSPAALQRIFFVGKALLASVIMAVSAQITIELPLVPMTGQTLALFVLALVLGSKLAATALVFYLIEGALGLPVFANASSGTAVLLGESGGYLFSYPIAAFVVGKFADNGCLASIGRTAIAVLVGTLIVFAAGLAQLAVFVPAAEVLKVGLYPFITSAIVKGVLAVILALGINKFLQKNKSDEENQN